MKNMDNESPAAGRPAGFLTFWGCAQKVWNERNEKDEENERNEKWKPRSRPAGRFVGKFGISLVWFVDILGGPRRLDGSWGRTRHGPKKVRNERNELNEENERNE